VTSADATLESDRQTAAMRSASVSMRLTGSPPTTAATAAANRAVVDRVGHVVTQRGPGQRNSEHDVDDEVLTLGTLVFEDAVVAAYPQSGHRDPVVHVSSWRSATEATGDP
jgi:hypothetical protein